MRRVAVLGLLALAGFGCGAAVRWERPGVSEADRQRDEADCTGLASRQFDPAPQGIIVTSGAPPEAPRPGLSPYDPVAFDECMRGRGYERVAPRPPA
jgi:hypothetical protein